MSAQSELAAIHQDVRDREAYFWPTETALPPAIAEAMAGFIAFAKERLGIADCEVKFFAPGPRDSRWGFVTKNNRRVAWVAPVTRDGRPRSGAAIADTIAHELTHAAGYETEAAAKLGAKKLVALYFGEGAENSPIEVPALRQRTETKHFLRGESM